VRNSDIRLLSAFAIFQHFSLKIQLFNSAFCDNHRLLHFLSNSSYVVALIRRCSQTSTIVEILCKFQEGRSTSIQPRNYQIAHIISGIACATTNWVNQ